MAVSNWLISSKDWVGGGNIGLTTQLPYLQKCLIHLATSSLKNDPGKTIPFDMQGCAGVVGGEEWQGLQRSEMLRTQKRSVFQTGLCLSGTESCETAHRFLKRCFRAEKTGQFLGSSPWMPHCWLQKETDHIIFLSLKPSLESLQPSSRLPLLRWKDYRLRVGAVNGVGERRHM